MFDRPPQSRTSSARVRPQGIWQTEEVLNSATLQAQLTSENIAGQPKQLPRIFREFHIAPVNYLIPARRVQLVQLDYLGHNEVS